MGTLPDWSPSPASGSSPRRQSSDGDDPSEVKLPTQIAHILQRLARHHTLITVILPECEDLFSSTILAFDRNAGILSIDELNPEEGHGLLLTQKRLQVTARLKGIAVDFETSLQTSRREDGIAIYSIAVPSMLHYHQRRAHFRAVIGAAHEVPIVLHTTHGRVIQGQVHDISPGGIGALFHQVAADEFQCGERLENCVIELPRGHTVHSPMEVCFVDPSEAPAQLRLGGRFIELTRGNEHMIARFIADLERQRLKTRPKE